MRVFMASVAGLFLSAGLLPAAEAAVDYTKDIKPILAKNCYSCHGGGKAKGRLRVDSLAAMLKGGDSGPSVLPGKAKDSPLIHSLTGDGDIKRMPPKGRGLSNDDIALLKKWVDSGAKGPADEKADVANAPDKKPTTTDRRRRGRREEMRKRESERKKDEDRKKGDDGDKKKGDDDDKKKGDDDDKKKGDGDKKKGDGDKKDGDRKEGDRKKGDRKKEKGDD